MGATSAPLAAWFQFIKKRARASRTTSDVERPSRVATCLIWPWILRSTGTLPTVFLELLRDAGLETHVIEDRRCVPLSELDVNALIVELLEREGYVNLLALAAGAELVGGAARVQRGALDLS